MRIVLILAACSVLLAACNAPGLRLRDDYTGQRLFEPNLVPEPTRRDVYGNAIPSAPPREPTQWPVYRP